MASTCAGFNLRRASRAVSQHFDHALAPAGLRMTQFTLLGALALAGSTTINRLARSLVVDRTTLTRNLRLLRQAGLIASEPGRTGRERQVSLTPAGRDALRRAFPLWRAAQADLLQAFDPARWPTLLGDLDRLVDGVIGAHTHPTLPAPNGAPRDRSPA
jgi:DNA-binding MarR family transcriptional regulator